MKKYNFEFQIGVFVLIGVLCLAYITIKLGKMEFFSNTGQTITANFASVAGLRTGAEVEISGVAVGKVTAILLVPSQNGAKVSMLLEEHIALTDDTIASIKTSGIIGDKYVNLSIGGGDPVKSGGELTETESSVDIEALISKYVFGGV